VTTEPLVDLNEWISKLPEDLQVLAQDAAPVLLNMGQDELLEWITHAIEGDYEIAYAGYFKRLTTEEQLAEGQRLNARLVVANQVNYARRKYVQDLVKSVVTLGLLYLRARFIGM